MNHRHLNMGEKKLLKLARRDRYRWTARKKLHNFDMRPTLVRRQRQKLWPNVRFLAGAASGTPWAADGRLSLSGSLSDTDTAAVGTQHHPANHKPPLISL